MKKAILPIILVLACALALNPAWAQPSKKKGSKTRASSGQTAETAKPKAAEAAAPEAAPAAEAAKDGEKKSAEKKDDKKDDASAGAFNFGGDMPFDLIRALSIEYDPNGMTVLTGQVRVESKQMNISCELVKMNNDTKILIATGNPVKMDQGDKMQAQCRTLTYHLDTKSAVLDTDAQIVQSDGKQKKQAKADTIKIDYPPSENGKENPDAKPKISLISRGTNLPEIRTVDQESKSSGDKKPDKPKRVTSGNLDMIQMPSLPKAPGVE